MNVACQAIAVNAILCVATASSGNSTAATWIVAIAGAMSFGASAVMCVLTFGMLRSSLDLSRSARRTLLASSRPAIIVRVRLALADDTRRAMELQWSIENWEVAPVIMSPIECIGAYWRPGDVRDVPPLSDGSPGRIAVDCVIERNATAKLRTALSFRKAGMASDAIAVTTVDQTRQVVVIGREEVGVGESKTVPWSIDDESAELR